MWSRREAASEAERWEERFNTVEEASKQLIAESLDARRDVSFASRTAWGAFSNEPKSRHQR